MFDNPKHVFWQAFLAAAIVFSFGIWMGFLLENYRTGLADIANSKMDLDLMDVKLQSDLYKNYNMNINCNLAVEENILFADKIFEEGKTMERDTKANTFTEDIIYQHKKLDLLRVIFWINSINIKQKCNSSYHNVVYFYQFVKPNTNKGAEQNIVSNVLSDLKQKYGNEIMLIPIAADNNITSLKFLADYYNITYLPTTLIDEKAKFEGIVNLEELERSIQ